MQPALFGFSGSGFGSPSNSRGFMVDAADASLLVTVQRIAGIPLGALAALRMVTGHVDAATLAARSASCQASPH
jgi:hypothetical protein